MKFDYYASLANEIIALNRQMSQLIGCNPKAKSGFDVSSSLRLILQKILPGNTCVAKGWVVRPEGCANYTDVLIYEETAPDLYKEGNQVILMPAATKAMIRLVKEVKNESRLNEIWEDWTSFLPEEVGFHALLVLHSELRDMREVEKMLEAQTFPLNPSGRAAFMLGREDVFTLYFDEEDSEEGAIQLEHIQIWLPDCEHPALSYIIHELINSLGTSQYYPAFELRGEETEEAILHENEHPEGTDEEFVIAAKAEEEKREAELEGIGKEVDGTVDTDLEIVGHELRKETQSGEQKLKPEEESPESMETLSTTLDQETVAKQKTEETISLEEETPIENEEDLEVENRILNRLNDLEAAVALGLKIQEDDIVAEKMEGIQDMVIEEEKPEVEIATDNEQEESSEKDVLPGDGASDTYSKNARSDDTDSPEPEPIKIPRKSKKDPIYIPVKTQNPLTQIHKVRQESRTDSPSDILGTKNSMSKTPEYTVKNYGVDNPGSYDSRAATINSPAKSPDIYLDNKYPLHQAVLQGNVERVKSLLNNNEETENKDRLGNTALHIAADGNQIEVVRLLIGKLADVNARNYVYASPLHLAVAKDHHEIVALLVDNGAEIEVRNNRGYTPMHKASEWGSIKSARVLIKHYADIHTRMERDLQPLHLAAWYGQAQMVQLLIDHGAELNAINSDGNTALHFAAFNGQVKVIKVLINNNANPNIRNLEGETYLQGINKGYQGEMRKVLE